MAVATGTVKEKRLPFLGVLTCRSCWKKEQVNVGEQKDERKLLKFQASKDNEHK